MTAADVHSLADQVLHDAPESPEPLPSRDLWPAPEMQLKANYRIAWDSVNPDAIKSLLAITPKSEWPELIIGYPDFGWADEDFAYFEKLGFNCARISQRDPGDPRHCSIGDLEPGAMTKLGLRQFIVARDGFRPGTGTGYASIDNFGNVGQALTGLTYWAWVAWWPNYPTPAEIDDIHHLLPAGARLAAVQYFNDKAADVDFSVVTDPDWHKA